VIKFVIDFVDHLIPDSVIHTSFLGIHFPGFGLIIALIVLLLTGIVATNIFGQKLLNIGDRIILQIPIVKSIYKGIKQVSDTLLSSKGNAFRRALLVQFPQSNTWTIAFITGTPSPRIITGDEETEYLSVYVPTTPNPTSGYFIIVKKSDTRELDMTVDEALRYVISMGAVDPTQTH
jgi:uncharacterized membrane protein